MTKKIIVEFDRKELLKECRAKQRTIHWSCCEYCKRSNKELIHFKNLENHLDKECPLYFLKFKFCGNCGKIIF